MSIVLDIVLVLVIVGFAVCGFRKGVVQSVGATAGLIAGGVGAALLVPIAVSLVPAGTASVVTSIAVAAVLLLVGYGIGGAVGGAIGGALRRTPAAPVDRALGAGMQLVVSALAVSLLALLAVSAGGPEVDRPVAGSVVLGAIRTATPAPGEQVLAEVGSTVTRSGVLPDARS